ncbi:placenta-specific gene 8 protein-like [Anguilla anguilla]|uniref:placenta-specific gene 8 protein-like n=1 Tax=Anguilla anguilla TaxID=7936 RepID=UPI0015AC381F|nr:placenta-specific gene 8 protein-like [Anguilla anguilla]
MATTVVVQQPLQLLPQAEAWSTGLFHCFRDMKIFCLYFWCFYCMACDTAQKFGECLCLPLVDLLGTALTTMMWIPICVAPIGLSMRVSVRQKYGIPGTISDDCPIATFCVPCSWCQIAREIKLRSQACTVISHQPAPLNSWAPGGAVPLNSPAPAVLTAPPMGVYDPPSYTASQYNPPILIAK